ncbi:MAG: PqqD family protein [Acidobacteriota bacterium]|nr:MAG: PqqD family protein [Acidobacteriota bacterium]
MNKAHTGRNIGELVYRRHRDVSFTRFGEEGLIVVPRESWQLVVNGVGARVFELLDGVRTIAEIAAQVAEEYDASSREIINDVGELLVELSDRGAAQIVTSDQ